MIARRWNCCPCCERIARTDHVGQGGSIAKDMHEGPCTLCRQTYHADSHDIAQEN